MPKYELSLSPDYVPKWTEVEAVRELFQNALDHEASSDKNKMFWNYSKDGKVFTLRSTNARLSRRSLLLGETTKADDDKAIGTFGEGYKLSFLVLARLGYTVEVLNGTDKEWWYPRISKSKRYDGDILVVDIEKKFPSKNDNTDLVFVINGISSEVFERLCKSNLHMSQPGQVAKTDFGKILLEDNFKGQVFVNGLYVTTDPHMQYGYNIKPRYLNIGRDRDLVGSFDLRWVTSQMWNQAERPGIVTKLIKTKAQDVEYLKSFAGQKSAIAKTIWADFVGTNGKHAIPVTSQAEYDLIRKSYTKLRPIIVSDQVMYITRGYYGEAHQHATKRHDNRSPDEMLRDFHKKIRLSLSTDKNNEFERIIKKSVNWTFK